MDRVDYLLSATVTVVVVTTPMAGAPAANQGPHWLRELGFRVTQVHSGHNFQILKLTTHFI